VSCLIRAHRRRLSGDDLADQRLLSPRDALRLAVLLRIGVRLHRSRSPLPARYRFEAKGRTLRLTLTKSWLRAHPLTLADLEDESRLLQDAGFRLRVG
jgi:exopolyphosphatase/guanosine-5'-triphosphate,3'-diphosphate pyrophosphatase